MKFTSMVTGEVVEYEYILGTCCFCHKPCNSQLYGHPECYTKDISRLNSIVKKKKKTSMDSKINIEDETE